MNQILTDILGLLKRKKVVADAKDTDLIPLGSKKSGSLGLSGPNPSEDVTLITASDFVTNYVAPKVGPTTNNTVYGLDAFPVNTTGTNNVAIGYQSLLNNDSGSTNVSIGSEAMKMNISGSSNTAVGVAALKELTTAVDNTSVGFISFLFTNQDRNTGLGSIAGYNSRTGDNTYIGYRSGNEAWNGGENTAVGSQSHKSVWNSSASQNVAVGKDALLVVSSGSENTAVGYYSQGFNATGNSNTSVGFNSMGDGTGNNNSALGVQTMFNLDGGNYNTAIGSGSLYELTTGSFNTICGGDEYGTQTANGNCGLGYSINTNDFSHSVLLGREATATASNQFVVGSSTYNAGAVTTASAAQTKTWDVIINGVAEKILLA